MAVETDPLLRNGMKPETWTTTPPPRTAAAPFTKALRRGDGIRVPQTIGHRGYKAAFPENTMAAFTGAVAVGAHAIETDVHLSRDKVVVLSHDPTLKRCFGEETKIADRDWSYLKTLQTIQEPQQAMSRLTDLLEYLSQPKLQHIWVLLDIKLDDDADELIGQIAKTIASVPSATPWKERIVLGGWNENYIAICKEHLPGFQTAYIGWSLYYARRFLGDPSVAFNLAQQVLPGPLGSRFLKAARKAEQPVFAWTVNDEQWMEWCIDHEMDAVITDDPKRFRDLVDGWNNPDDGAAGTGVGSPEGNMTRRSRRMTWGQSVRMAAHVIMIQVLVLFYYFVAYKRVFQSGQRKQVGRKPPPAAAAAAAV